VGVGVGWGDGCQRLPRAKRRASADAGACLGRAGVPSGPDGQIEGVSGALGIFLNDCDRMTRLDEETYEPPVFAWCDEETNTLLFAFAEDPAVMQLLHENLEVRHLYVPSVGVVKSTPEPPTTLIVDIPGAGPIFGEETGVVLLFDDGIDGLTAFDPDSRLVARSTVDGQRAGDEPYSMIRVGGHLVVGWGEPHAVDIASRQGVSLAEATIFLPAAESDRVWLVDYPGGRIGGGPPLVWQVGLDGNMITEPVLKTPGSGHPLIGFPGGLVLQADAGLSLWYADTEQIVDLDAGGTGFVVDSSDDLLAWCFGDCSQLRITDTSTSATQLFNAPSGYARFRVSGRFSPNGRHLAVLVGGADIPVEGEAIWILDRDTGDVTVIGDPESHADFLAWSPDGEQLFATSGSYGGGLTAVWRYEMATDDFTSVVLPFGGAITPVVIDAAVADSYFGGELIDPSECRAPTSQPSQRSGICTFGL